MRKFKALIAVGAAFFAVSALAVEIDKTTIKNKGKFGIIFPDNTSFYANADTVLAISRQTYYAGPLYVTEVVIDVMGSASQVRIYNAEAIQVASEAEKLADAKLPENLKPYAKTPDSIKERLAEAQKQAAGISSIPQIQKIYPVTTNSKTIEFIVPSRDELEDFYTLLSNDFIGKPTEGKDISKDSKDAIKDSVPGLKGKLYKLQPAKNMKNLYEIFNRKNKSEK